jgi:hypothetical protein
MKWISKFKINQKMQDVERMTPGKLHFNLKITKRYFILLRNIYSRLKIDKLFVLKAKRICKNTILKVYFNSFRKSIAKRTIIKRNHLLALLYCESKFKEWYFLKWQRIHTFKRLTEANEIKADQFRLHYLYLNCIRVLRKRRAVSLKFTVYFSKAERICIKTIISKTLINWRSRYRNSRHVRNGCEAIYSFRTNVLLKKCFYKWERNFMITKKSLARWKLIVEVSQQTLLKKCFDSLWVTHIF